jgi:hypothetical protein
MTLPLRFSTWICILCLIAAHPVIADDSTSIEPFFAEAVRMAQASMPRDTSWKSLNKTEVLSLRAYTADASPDYRALACEAIAAHRVFNALPAVMPLVTDDTPALTLVTADAAGRTMTVGSYAKKALYDLTCSPNALQSHYAPDSHEVCFFSRTFFDEISFLAWWKDNADYERKLWYWEERFRFEQMQPSFESAWDELRRGSPEFAAKIVLLYDTGTYFYRHRPKFWQDESFVAFLKSSLSRARLLEILNRKGLEPDWEELARPPLWRTYYDRVTTRLVSFGRRIFDESDLPQLKEILAEQQQYLFLSKADLLALIAALEPTSGKEMLLEKIAKERDIFVRAKLAGNLIKEFLPEAGQQIVEIFFREKFEPADPDVREAIVEGLARHKNGQAWLAAIVQDERFLNLTTQGYSAFFYHHQNAVGSTEGRGEIPLFLSQVHQCILNNRPSGVGFDLDRTHIAQDIPICVPLFDELVTKMRSFFAPAKT